jgi:hypothetical protein
MSTATHQHDLQCVKHKHTGSSGKFPDTPMAISAASNEANEQYLILLQ